MKAKKLRRSFAATSTVASKTPPFASSRPMVKKGFREAAVAPTKSWEGTWCQPLEKSLMTIEPKEKAKPQQFPISQTSASGSMSPPPTNASSFSSAVTRKKLKKPENPFLQSVTTPKLSVDSTTTLKLTQRLGPEFSPETNPNQESKSLSLTLMAKRVRS